MKALDIRTVAVIGAGTMGAGIAGVFARAGCEVRLADTSRDLLDRGLAMLRSAQEALIEAGLFPRRRAAAALARVQPVPDRDAACPGTDLLVEAVPEDLALKRDLMARFDMLCPSRALIATNTSGLSISSIAEATRRPARVAGMHFWNPPHVIPLVEIVRGRQTSAATVKTLTDLAWRIGKRPVVVRKDAPGFIGNRLQFAVFREALHLLSEGIASAEDIDAAMTAGPGLRWGVIGPLRTADLGGLDVFGAISEYLFAALCSAKRPPEALRELVRRRKLGAKTGEGFYRYPPRERERILARRDRALLEFLKVLSRET
jgi:3-hydroxybutyryl-CoA dehydrogenase